MKIRYICVLAGLLSLSSPVYAGNGFSYDPKTLTAVRTSEPIKMDGVLNEPVWKNRYTGNGFHTIRR